MPFFQGRVVLPFFEFGIRYLFLPFGAVDLVLRGFDSVQPILYMVSLNENPALSYYLPG